MQSISAATFYATSVDVQKFRAAIERWQETFPPTNLITKGDKDTLILPLQHLNAELVKLDCGSALATIGKIARAMDDNTLTYGGVAELFHEMDGRIRDELARVYVFSLSAQEAAMYDPAEPLITSDFPQKFPSAVYDVEECAKCLVQGRSTAAVFHAMRVLERGVAAVAACLGIPDPVKPGEKQWGRMLESIKGAIDQKWPKVEDRESGDGHLFESLYATLAAIRNPWRNKTMHPAQIYTEQQAGKIVTVVGQFMEELAARCDEKGQPSL